MAAITHAPLGFPDNGHGIKELVVCNSWYVLGESNFLDGGGWNFQTFKNNKKSSVLWKLHYEANKKIMFIPQDGGLPPIPVWYDRSQRQVGNYIELLLNQK